MVGIYKITSPSGKVYIGQSVDIQKRWRSYHDCNIGRQHSLKNSILKYGCQNHIFEVVHELPKDISQEVINEYEVTYWQFYRDCGIKMLNIRLPGDNKGPNSPETRLRISAANTGKISPHRGRTDFFRHTDEWKKKSSERSKGNKSRTGMKNSPEAIKKTADSRRGIPRSEEVRRKISEAQKGKIISEECRKKLSLAIKGKPNYKNRHPHSEETKLKIREALKGKGRIPWNKGKDGYRTQPDEIKKKISEASLKMWANRKNKTIING